MKVIDRTIIDNKAPKRTNVIWVDTSGDMPVEKHFIKGRWREISGGCAGSSNPTEADATKVWQVTPVQKGTKTEEIVIVPEQTLVNEQELEYNDKFVPGAQCVAIVNGVEYRGEVVEGLKDDYIFEEGFGMFWYAPTRETFRFANSTEFDEVTAKLSVIEETPIYDYNWAPGVKIPIPTAEDEGKILVVSKVEGDTSKEYELAPTQTVVNTVEEQSQELQTTSNIDKFIEGAIVTVVLDGITYTEHVSREELSLYVEIDGGDKGYLDTLTLNPNGETMLTFWTGDFWEHEISVSIIGAEYNYEYQLQGSTNSSGLSIPVFKWENGDTAVHYDTLPKVNDIIYFTYSDRRQNMRLFPIVVTSISENNNRVTGTFMPFGTYAIVSGGSTGTDLYNDYINFGDTNFGTNWEVNIKPVTGGYAVSYVAGQVG